MARGAGAAGVVLWLAVAAPADARASPSQLAPAHPRPTASSLAGTHVRGLNVRARALLDEAPALSPTVRCLVTALEVSDVIVLVDVGFRSDRVAADLQLLATTGGFRVLLVSIDKLQGRLDQVELLGHELQHALEVAATPRVRTARDLVALMARLSRRGQAGPPFETQAAVTTGRQVRKELLAGGRR